ncbi:hypothetical protein Tco_1001206, partial [Tanacetum coccineum]
MLHMDACYLELKVPSRSRRDGSCDFLDRYGHHYGDAIARPLLPSEVTANANILNDALTARNNVNIDLEFVLTCLINSVLKLHEIINLASSLEHLCDSLPSCDLVTFRLTCSYFPSS